jgi:IS1 family transposase
LGIHWGFIGKKDSKVKPGDDPQFGTVWTFCAIDAETKLVPAFKVESNRSLPVTTAFMREVASRMRNRVQVSTDSLRAYRDAVEAAWGANVDYAPIVKIFGHEDREEHRYAAPEVIGTEKRIMQGNPDYSLISASYVERLNATTRLHMRRLTRLTLAFSKRFENFRAAFGLHFAYYNLVRRHNTLRCTPAMAAGVESTFWTVGGWRLDREPHQGIAASHPSPSRSPLYAC